MAKKILLAALVACSFAIPNGRCVVPQTAPLGELVAQADVVVVVSDVQALPIEKGDGDYYFRVSALAVKVLKGGLSEKETLVVRINKTVSERSPTCCDGGTSYLMFLYRNSKGELTPIRVVNSVVNLGRLT